MKTDLIDLTRQCCDADGYLSLGYRCAQTNFCYDELRPIGDALWFSLPYRLGLGVDCLLYIQGLLVVLVGFSLFALLRRAWLPWALAMAALVLQIWPTFFNSLADTPASLLLIEGLLLALLAAQRQHTGLFLLAGICLGSSSLLRAAYFNPLCAAALVFFVIWFWHAVVKKQKQFRNAILLFSFTLPMALQFYVSWKNMQEWSFLSRAQTQVQFDAHLNSAVVGYDTLLIESSYYWAPSCAPSRGVWTGIREGNIKGLGCLLAGRIYFYLGSYAPHTFYGNENKNFISNGFANEVGHISAWSLHNTSAKTRHAQSPVGDMKASLLQPKHNEQNSYVQSPSLITLAPGRYRYSIWLWTADNNTNSKATIQFFSKTLSQQNKDWDEQFLNETDLVLSKEPKQFWLETDLPKSAYLVTRINISGDVFAWGAMLETAKTSSGYLKSSQLLFSPIGSTPSVSGHERLFSKLLLALNLAAILASFVMLLWAYLKTDSPTYIFVTALLALILVEALLILPEQRFLQASLAMHWILLAGFLYQYLADKKFILGATDEH